MTKPMVRVYTDAENFIDREMNEAEYAQWIKDKEATDSEMKQMQAAAAAKQALLDRLGITADEARLLLS